jgi:hypothetical protein
MGQFTFVACSYKKLEPKIRFLWDFFPWKPFLAPNFESSKHINHNFSYRIQNRQNIVFFLRNLRTITTYTYKTVV